MEPKLREGGLGGGTHPGTRGRRRPRPLYCSVCGKVLRKPRLCVHVVTLLVTIYLSTNSTAGGSN